MAREGQTEDKFANPYVAGIALGVVLYLSYLVTGHGLGASGGLARLVTMSMKSTRVSAVDQVGFFATLGGGFRKPLDHWLVWEILGVVVGGALSGILAKRFRLGWEKGPKVTIALRALLAVVGGALVGWGTQFSRGCTSGQALSGGAVLSVGSWAFMFAVFGGAYLVAYPLRRLWR